MLLQRIIIQAMVILLTAGGSLAVGAGKDTVAIVNGVAITSSQLDREVDRLIPLSTYHRTVSDERRQEIVANALDNLVVRELQVQDAVARGIKPDKKKVKEQLERVRDQYPSKKEYKAALDRSGFTEDELRREIEGLLMVQALMNQVVTGPAQMSDEDLKKYYDANQEKFLMPESAKVRIISTWDEKKASEAVEKIKAGESFNDVAARISEDKYRVVGGEVGWLHRGQLIQTLEDAAFASPANKLIGPIKAEGMWYVLLLEEKKASYQRTFEESRDKLKTELEQKRAQELQKAWIAELRSNANIDIKMAKTAPPTQ